MNKITGISKSKNIKADTWLNKLLIFQILLFLFINFILSYRLAADDRESPYGIIAHVPDNKALNMCARLGVKWIRVDFNWYAIEPAKGKFNWSETDRVVKKAGSCGLYIYATLAYAPKWANGGENFQHPALNPRDWHDFVFATVSRYRDSIRHWGMWNEPNLPGFFSGTPDDYVNIILKIGRDAVKAADPEGLVLGPELSHSLKGGQRWNIWMKQILLSGGNYIDIITHHIYKDSPLKIYRLLSGFTWPWEPPSVMEIIKQNGCADKQIWLTETGWCTHEMSFEEQKEKLKELLDLAELHQWPDKIFIYQLFDDTVWKHKFGILKSDLTLKPAYNAYKYHIQRYRNSIDTVAPFPEKNNFPDYYIIEAENDPSHRQGRRESDGWACDPVLHPPDYMCLGPEIAALPEETCNAVFRILIDNIEKDESDIALIEIYESASDMILASRKINRLDFNSPFQYQDFILTFSSVPGRRIVPRVFWYGNTYTRVNRITVTGIGRN